MFVCFYQISFLVVVRYTNQGLQYFLVQYGTSVFTSQTVQWSADLVNVHGTPSTGLVPVSNILFQFFSLLSGFFQNSVQICTPTHGMPVRFRLVQVQAWIGMGAVPEIVFLDGNKFVMIIIGIFLYVFVAVSRFFLIPWFHVIVSKRKQP